MEVSARVHWPGPAHNSRRRDRRGHRSSISQREAPEAEAHLNAGTAFLDHSPTVELARRAPLDNRHTSQAIQSLETPQIRTGPTRHGGPGISHPSSVLTDMNVAPPQQQDTRPQAELPGLVQAAVGRCRACCIQGGPLPIMAGPSVHQASHGRAAWAFCNTGEMAPPPRPMHQ